MKEIKEKQNSFAFRYGGTGTDMKIYFEDALDLDVQLRELALKATAFKTSVQRIKEGMLE